MPSAVPDELYKHLSSPTDGGQLNPAHSQLAHGVPARVAQLRGYGNAIVPQVAQAFVEAYLEC